MGLVKSLARQPILPRALTTTVPLSYPTCSLILTLGCRPTAASCVSLATSQNVLLKFTLGPESSQCLMVSWF